MGEIAHPMSKPSPYRISAEGTPMALPGVGSITYNVKVGDLVNAFEADHVEPGVSIKNHDKTFGAWDPNLGLTFLSCIGNPAVVISGDAKGEKGYVTGKHGGIEHVLVHFKQETLEKLVIGDKIQIKAWGVGMQAEDFPDMKVMNIDPELLERMNLKVSKGRIKFKVTHLIPGKLMGSGLGSDNTYIGDYDIQLFDEKAVKEYNLDTLRYGDFVALADVDNSYGRIWKEGAVTIGIVVHSSCVVAGHGPGVTTIMTSRAGIIDPVIDAGANLINYM